MYEQLLGFQAVKSPSGWFMFYWKRTAEHQEPKSNKGLSLQL